MDIAVPSRFACLRIEDDEFRPVTSKNKKRPETVKTGKKPSVPTPSTNNGKRIPGLTVKQTSTKKTKSKGKQENKQWEEWKRKDDELVNDNFEQDLQCAILQSKLDFEKQKKNAVIKTDSEANQAKKKKGKTMSLDQFLDNGTQSKPKEETTEKVKQDGDFFEKVLETAKQEVTKEKVEENRRKRQENLEEIITLAHCQEKLEKERAKNAALKKQLEDAKKEIASVKKRNTTLCNMLSQGEMKDKAEVLLELEGLTSVKEELTEEVTRLHKLLEQERSSKSNGMSESHSKHKEKNKKKKN